MTGDPWHFRRAGLAEQVLGTLAHGPAQALSLFAPRRAGKTEFLVQDLAPHAEAKGHLVIYASFWQAPLTRWRYSCTLSSNRGSEAVWQTESEPRPGRWPRS